MNYLNQDHSAFRQSADLKAYAVRKLFASALLQSHSFILQFDRLRLEHVIGTVELQRIMPDLSSVAKAAREKSHSYDIYEGRTDKEKNEILKRLLSLTEEKYSELPLTYIRTVRLLDKNGTTVLRAGDRNSFILFSFSESDHDELLQDYARHGIPSEAIEQIEVDIQELRP